MHGTEDEVVPFSNGEGCVKLCRDAHDPMWFEGAGHNDVPEERAFRYVGLFLDWLEARRGGREI